VRDARDIYPVRRFVVTTRATYRPAGLIARALALSTPLPVPAIGMRRSVPGRLSPPLRWPLLLPAPLISPLGWRGTRRFPRGPVTHIAIRLGAFHGAISALIQILILSTAVFGVLLVLQIGASLVQWVAGSTPPGAPRTSAGRRALRCPTLVRPRNVLARLPTPPGSGLGLLVALPPPALALIVNPWPSLRLPPIGVAVAGFFLLPSRFGCPLRGRGGPAPAAISGALGSLVVLSCWFLVVSFVRGPVAIVVFQKSVSPHQNRRGSSH